MAALRYAVFAAILAVGLYAGNIALLSFVVWYIKNAPTLSFVNVLNGAFEIKAGGFGGKTLQQICAAMSNNYSEEFWDDDTSPAKCDKYIMGKATNAKNAIYVGLLVCALAVLALL